MKNWLARLFGGAAAAPGAATAVAASAAAAAASGAGAAIGAGDEDAAGAARRVLDAAFWRWLTQDVAGEPTDAARQRALDAVARLATAPGAAADMVPRVPEVIPRLLRSLRDEGVSSGELARQVARDPALLAETIREANSPFYRPASPVRSIDAAVMVLGQNGLRMLIARAAFRPVIGMRAGACANRVAPQVWRHSERCARVAGLLAPGLGADPFEAYLAGLMHDVGLVVAFRLFDRFLGTSGVPQDVAFAAAALDGARALSARIAQHWELPAPVAGAIVRAGRAGTRPLAEALGQADRLAKLRLLFDAGALGADDARLATLPAAQAHVFGRLGDDAA
ncbi:HDOD domain-containing protein [uncultured Massilia sp.]|uniref:HDOD domain-containing protein n=1 Tax=uncultured Massilia sp. TaxID=169973 RepID=UPI0025DC9034|nr:HDOD domain-containing protein [uncultured Massilia sp.]